VKNTDPKYRLDEAETEMLKEALATTARHYAFLAGEADVLGDPMAAEALRVRGRHFLTLAGQAQDVTRVTVRLSAYPTF
jgi:hypothetical protein